jgi:pectate lyase
VAQTAFREPVEPQAPSCLEPVSELPAVPVWAAGAVTESPLVASYAAGAGPGIWITARDQYRLYLNGALIAEGSAPRQPDFVPLSLLPGANLVALAIWAETGTPAALLQLDELTRSYVSDDSWQVTSTPGASFADVGDEVTPWLDATVHGRFGALQGCDPADGFPADSLARWIGPAANSGTSAVLRQVIRVSPIGFGAAASGGGVSEPVLAETWQALEALATEPDTPTTILIPEGDYDFRRQGDDVEERLVCPSSCTEDPNKMLYRVLTSDETCPIEQVMMMRDERTLSLGSNKTLVGLGRGARLRGVSLEVGDAQNVVVRNLALYDVNRGLIEAGDAIGMQGASDIWLDHVTTKWISDGLTDISPGTRNVTLSWMHYDGILPAACRGQHTHPSTIHDSSVTLHHSFFDHGDSHTPLVDGEQAQVHIFNNLIQDNAGYGVGAACGAQVLLEATTFENVRTPTALRDCGDDVPPMGLIGAPPGSNLYLSDIGEHAGGDGQEPRDAVFKPGYEYEVEPAVDAWPIVAERAGAGGRWALPLSLDP